VRHSPAIFPRIKKTDGTPGIRLIIRQSAQSHFYDSEEYLWTAETVSVPVYCPFINVKMRELPPWNFGQPEEVMGYARKSVFKHTWASGSIFSRIFLGKPWQEYPDYGIRE
jgi:hypothetical protein